MGFEKSLVETKSIKEVLIVVLIKVVDCKKEIKIDFEKTSIEVETIAVCVI